MSTARATSESTMTFFALKRSRNAPPIQLVITRGNVDTAMTAPMCSTEPVSSYTMKARATVDIEVPKLERAWAPSIRQRML